MGHRGRLQVKPEKKQRGAGPVPVKIEDEWTDAGKVRVFTFSDGTKTRVPWRNFIPKGTKLGHIEPPTLEEVYERRMFPPEAVARANEALAPMWVRGARAMVGGGFVFGLGLCALGVRGLIGAVDGASELVEVAGELIGYARSLIGGE